MNRSMQDMVWVVIGIAMSILAIFFLMSQYLEVF